MDYSLNKQTKFQRQENKTTAKLGYNKDSAKKNKIKSLGYNNQLLPDPSCSL